MKIMQIIPTFSMGGAETMCETLCLALKNAGNEVTAVSLYSEETPITARIKESGINLVFLSKRNGFDLKTVFALKKLIRKEKPDVIHTHLYALKYAVLACLFGKIKIVHTLHNVASKEASKKDIRFNGVFYKKGRVTPVALSEAVRETVLSLYGLEKNDVPVVLNGINIKKCTPKTDYKKSGDFTFINVARMSLQKNHKRLLSAFCRVLALYPDCKLQIIGDGELKAELENYSNELKISEKVEFLGLKSDVHPYLNGADAFVLSSDYEGIPMTVIEAMATALPIVSTAVGGVPDMTADKTEGLLTACDDKALSDAMIKLYENEELRRTLGQNAYKRSDVFSADNMAKSYLEIYGE